MRMHPPGFRASLALTALLTAAMLSACGTGHGSSRVQSSPRISRTTSREATATRAKAPRLLASRRPMGAPVSVVVGVRASGSTIPPRAVGLSFELRELPLLARYASRGDLVALLRSLGNGVLRFGGTSADEQVAWAANQAQAARRVLPRWASTAIDPRDLAGIAALARASGWRVLLTVNLGHYDPAAAAREARAAHTALGSALAGIEIGNEPDRYVGKGLRGRGWDFATYGTQAAAYRAAIASAAPGVAIAGPDAASGVPGLAWLRGVALTMHAQLLTDHYYPLSSCGYRPTVGELSSPNLRHADGVMLAKMLAIARTAGAELRIDETNSVSCEGFPGVSDTFGSALWALGYTAQALTAGAAGLNFHDLLAKRGSYSPLLAPSPAALAAGALRVQPEWYALLAARELTGSRPLHTSVAGVGGQLAAAGGLQANAFRARDGRVRVVLVDYDPPGSQPLAVHLRIGGAPDETSETPAARVHARARARGGAASADTHTTSTSTSDTYDTPASYTGGSILRLTGPSPAATASARLAGRAVTTGGAWAPPTALPGVYSRDGALSVQLAPSSAAVVTLYPA
jgi:hypothetical protein